jgi:hypothetical protein
MCPLDARHHSEKLADAAAFHELELDRAASTVRSRVQDPTAQRELLECLGLPGVAPAGWRPHR